MIFGIAILWLLNKTKYFKIFLGINFFFFLGLGFSSKTQILGLTTSIFLDLFFFRLIFF